VDLARPAALSMPAIADVDADGSAEIILQDSRAAVHCLVGATASQLSR